MLLRAVTLSILILVLAGSATATAAAPRNGVFAGTSANAPAGAPVAPISLALNARGTAIKRLNYFYVATCTSGRRIPSMLLATNVVLDRGGSWSADDQQTVETAGGSEVQRFVDSGTVGSRSASGTFEVRLVLRNAEGATTDECTTGTQRWTARRGPRHFAGASPQLGHQITATTDRRATRIDQLVVSWTNGAACPRGGGAVSPPGDVRPVTVLRNLRLSRRGAFSRKGSYRYESSAGSDVRIDYSVRGTIRRGVLKATFTGAVTSVLPSGQPGLTDCRSGDVALTARSR